MGSVAISGPSTMKVPPAVFHDNPFWGLKGEAFAHFMSIAPETSRSRGESLFLEGETPACVYVLLSGRVKLTVTSREGKTAILRIAGPGKFLGSALA